MKSIALIILLLTSFVSFSHEYFFGFSELEYNDITRKFEATIIVSTHDFERALELAEVNVVDLAKIQSNMAEKNAVESYINRHFILQTQDRIKFNLIGSEVFLNGTSNFYFESEEIDFHDKLEVTFDLLMDVFKQQQNKITLNYRDNSYTRTFLYNERKQLIAIENN
ncbi:MAG: hypothetical protein MK105_08245 [Crocinitomicaceae bacterium]|nr:hypothetical protein [Crocinitomicaceae bacterium]